MKIIPPPIWAALALVIAGVITRFAPQLNVIDLRLEPLGAALLAAGFGFAIWAFVLFARAGTEVRPDSPANKALVVSGVYHVTRNPMYLGLVLITLGIAFWVGAPAMFLAPAIVFAICNWVHIPMEETKMRAQFADAYDAYARKVRRWI